MLGIDEALARILEDSRILGDESEALGELSDRVAAQAATARRALPPFDNSAMDGYAVRAADTAGAPVTLRVTETIPAGQTAKGTVGAGEAMRIFTGAPMPEGADAIVIQEDTEREGDDVRVLETTSAGKHIRRRGEDIAVGQAYIQPGDVIGAGEISMLAGQGQTFLRVVKQPRVSIVPNGDEVMEIDQELQPGQITNSNSHMLAAMVREAGGIPVRCPVAKDDPEALTEALRAAAAGADLILTCGGVSVGDFDHVRDVLGDAGRVDFWKVAIKPGKPLAYGRLAGVPLIGLPGNPVSAFVTFEVFARPALRKLGGHTRLGRPRASATLSRDVKPNRSRTELLRGTLVNRDGALLAEPFEKQGSGHLSSMLDVDALIEIQPGTEVLAAGSRVETIVLRLADLRLAATR